MSYSERENSGELQEGADDIICQAIREVKLDPYLFGKYLLEKVGEDRTILLELKKNIVKENDQHKVDFNDFKGMLLQMEHLALILTKQKL